MKRSSIVVTIATLLFYAARAAAEDTSVPTPIHHDIYIALKNTNQTAVDRQIAIGRKYLTDHPGELSFSATVLAQGLTRHQQVAYLHNDTDFQVAFHLVFKDAKSHDDYQNSERHVKYFIPMSKENWKELRVFDSAN